MASLASQIFGEVEVIGSRGVGVGQINKPRSVAVDDEENLYVVDMTGRVQKFSPAGQALLSWQMPQTDLGKPKGMCRDRQGRIVVIEPHYARVNHFSTAGQLQAQWGERGTNAGQLSVPRAVAINTRNEVFISEYQQAERVQVFSLAEPVRPRWLGAFGRPGTGPGEFNRPEGICVDAEDRVYVADSCNHRIQVFSREGKFLKAYGKAGKGLGELSYPYDVCVDSLGRQYVCEFGNSRIQVFDAGNRPVEIIGGPGPEPGRFSNPWGVALDSEGNLYVADSQNHRVQKLVRRVKDSPPVLTKNHLHPANGSLPSTTR
jgi:DNA-binding beta-propeller fold protein YncE